MKKMLLSAAFLAAMTSVSAQKLTYVPYADNGYLMGTYISSDGRYIAGGDAGGQGFIYDTQNGQIKYFVSPENGDETKDASTEVRAVNPDGTGVGYVGDKLCKFDFNTGEYTDLGVNEPALANTMSTDGSVIGGYAWDESTYMQHPIYLKDGVKYDLPMPTSTWLGYEANGFGLTGANADGSMFLGYVQDDFAAYPICVWVLNQDGKTYSVIPVSKRFYDSSIELKGPQPMDYFNGAFMSANGRWVALSVHNKDNTEQSYTLARYDVLNDALEYISCPEATQTLAYYATAISDDGTMIGYINDETSNARTGVICLAGDTVAHRLSEAFPMFPNWPSSMSMSSTRRAASRPTAATSPVSAMSISTMRTSASVPIGSTPRRPTPSIRSLRLLPPRRWSAPMASMARPSALPLPRACASTSLPMARSRRWW